MARAKPPQAKRLAMHAGGLVAAMLVGALLGRLSAGRTGPEADVSALEARTAAPSRPREMPRSSASDSRVAAERPTAGRPESLQPHGHDHDPAPTELATTRRPGFDGLFETYLRGLAEHAREAGPLGEELLREPGLLDEALARLRLETDPKRLAGLAALLGQVRHPKVEEDALALAAGARGPMQAAALDILDALDTPRAVPVVLPLLAGRGDPSVVAGVLFALPSPTGMSEEEARAVHGEVSRLASSAEDEEVRRRALLALGQWGGASGEEQLAHALTADPSPVARAGAAFALETRRARSSSAIAALVRAMSSREEDPTVRENAYQALRRLAPLPATAHEAYRRYEAEREGLGLGG